MRLGGNEVSRRESMIMQSAAEGRTDKQIAIELGLSLGTVRTYWGRIRTKLGASTRAQAVGMYIRSRSTLAQPSTFTEEQGRATLLFAQTFSLPAWSSRSDGSVAQVLTPDAGKLHERFTIDPERYPLGWLSSLSSQCRQEVLEALNHGGARVKSWPRVVRLDCSDPELAGHAVFIRAEGDVERCHVLLFTDSRSSKRSR